MSAALLDELLAGFAAPAAAPSVGPTLANSAKAAKHEQACGLAGNSVGREELRRAANPAWPVPTSGEDSRTFADVRSPAGEPEGEKGCGSSQHSQDSQGVAAQRAPDDLAAVAWTDIDIARFVVRRDRLLRWGWSETRAEVLAERLVQRDREGDDRRACIECRHLEGAGRCAWARMGRLAGADRRLEPVPDVLQRCPSFVPIALVDSEL